MIRRSHHSLCRQRPAARSPRARRNEGFSLLEVMVSLSILLLGVVSSAIVMILVERGAVVSEQRYQSFLDFRGRIEQYKARIGDPNAGTLAGINNGQSFTTGGGQTAVVTVTPVATMPNLTLVELKVDQSNGAPPARIVTYIRN